MAEADGLEERRPRRGALRTLARFLADCSSAGQKPIPPDDPVFAYCDTVGISRELLTLCWREFKRKELARQGRQRDWRRKFRNCVEGGWYRLWYLPAGEAARLTSAGEQVQRYFAAEDEARQRAANERVFLQEQRA